MIIKTTFGNPTFITDACVKKIETSAPLKYFKVEKTDTLDLFYTMDKKDIVYGLGENVRGINKRGYIYTSKCNDEGKHIETQSSLYAAHNFILVDGKERFGLFIDAPGIVSFDIGYQDIDEIHIQCENLDCEMYIIENDTLLDIVKEFRQLIGPSYLPPKWAFGYGQSRWGYRNSDDVRKIAHEYEKWGIPLDMIYLDIDYMENYKDFTINREAFPDFEELVKEMKQKGIRLIPIIDAGVRIESGYDVYEEGVQNNFFCKDLEGHDFVAGVWPGRCHFPDFLNPQAREWFGGHYKKLMDMGIEGFWNDMNEPSIFYTEKRLKEAFECAEKSRHENLNVDSFFQLVNKFSTLSNNREDYKEFTHNVNGKTIIHEDVHNQFGYNMTRAAMEAMEKISDQRTLLFSRSSAIGMHRYSGIWTGDNFSWWSHILLNIKMMPSLNMCGFLYTGADLGGFAHNTTEDLMMRWIQFGIFTPLMRNHSACEREQELFRFKDKEGFKHMIELRYALIPYLYSEFMKASQNYDMLFKPLGFVYENDPLANKIEDQLILGNLMLTPIYEQNATGRVVYLPEEMMLVRYRHLEDFDTEIFTKGHHYIPCELNECIFFVRKDSFIPLCKPASCTNQLDETNLDLLGFVENEACYELYNDDGVSRNLQGETKVIRIKKENEHFIIHFDDSLHCHILKLMRGQND